MIYALAKIYNEGVIYRRMDAERMYSLLLYVNIATVAEFGLMHLFAKQAYRNVSYVQIISVALIWEYSTMVSAVGLYPIDRGSIPCIPTIKNKIKNRVMTYC